MLASSELLTTRYSSVALSPTSENMADSVSPELTVRSVHSDKVLSSELFSIAGTPGNERPGDAGSWALSLFVSI